MLLAEGIGGSGGIGGTGQVGGPGGAAFGGTTQAGSFLGDGDGLTLAGSASFGTLDLSSDAEGGNRGSGIGTGSSDGGAATGGAAFLPARGVSVDETSEDMNAAGFGGAGSHGGDAPGGSGELSGTRGGAQEAGFRLP